MHRIFKFVIDDIYIMMCFYLGEPGLEGLTGQAGTKGEPGEYLKCK